MLARPLEGPDEFVDDSEDTALAQKQRNMTMSSAPPTGESDRAKPPRMQWTGVLLSLGAGVGMIVGLLIAGGAGIALGLAFGAGVGVVIGAAADAMSPRP